MLASSTSIAPMALGALAESSGRAASLQPSPGAMIARALAQPEPARARAGTQERSDSDGGDLARSATVQATMEYLRRVIDPNMLDGRAPIEQAVENSRGVPSDEISAPAVRPPLTLGTRLDRTV